ncbi:MAG: hypothetical protein RMM58_02060 [Chloroflexota bacterium]|nr:hypothetical protein [Dehalococcoidia bacterium]MDW8252642.1 hypothetical protein [Chloroflexota bacterium]
MRAVLAGVAGSVLALMMVLPVRPTAGAAPAPYSLTRDRHDGGGGLSAASAFQLVGAVGQLSVGSAAGEQYRLTAGFLHAAVTPPPPLDAPTPAPPTAPTPRFNTVYLPKSALYANGD